MADTGGINITPQDIAALYGLIHGGTGGATSDANKVADAADPYRSQRAQWQQPIVDLMKDPSSILKDPAFQASLNLGLENTSRAAGAAGMGLSGNRLADLQKYGQSAGYSAIQTKLKNLEDLAGVNSGSPAAAAKAIEQGKTNTMADVSQGIPVVGKILGALAPYGATAVKAFKDLLGGADPSTIDPATLEQIYKIIGIDSSGLGDFGPGGYTPGGTQGLFGGSGPGPDNPPPFDSGVPGGGSTGGDPFGPGATPDPFADGGGATDMFSSGFDWGSVDWDTFNWEDFFSNLPEDVIIP
jgi:hypothetical protein